MKSTFRLSAIFLFIAILFSACNEEKDEAPPAATSPEITGEMKLNLRNVWGPMEETFSVGQGLVQPVSGEQIRFTTLKYYVSNIQLHKTDGTIWKQPESYHLIKVSDRPNEIPEIYLPDVPEGDYDAISFLIGVDSLRNVSGAQEGALDPAEIMFWSWNTGYIFIKAEGESNMSVNGLFNYHVGGFTQPYSSIQPMYFDFQGDKLEIREDDFPSVHLVCRVDNFWDNGVTTENTPAVHTPGETAAAVAENFAGGFRFDHIHN